MVTFQQLPLELVRAILAEAMLVRGPRRALRLRLVNSKYLAQHASTLCGTIDTHQGSLQSNVTRALFH
jgi:hypothetical protein